MSSASDGAQDDSQRPGLLAINRACSKLYPSQINPLQATARVKYWLGGPDPLDYISMYYNAGTENASGDVAAEKLQKNKSPQHWHYVTCGFSDLHGDSRVHEVCVDPRQPSGFGFELTFRLCTMTSPPPTWPAELLQSLARYVFSSGNILCVGDHISWHAPLCPQDSRIHHMLLSPDPQLPPLHTPLGTVQFIQVVGVTAEELNAAQAWNGMGILNLMQSKGVCGGELLVTDIRRGASLFEVFPEARKIVEDQVRDNGSLLSGVSTVCSWEDGLGRPGSALTLDTSLELLPLVQLDKAVVKFNREAIQLWPLAIRGRLEHGNHFTFKNVQGDVAITLVSEGVEGALACHQCPLAAHGSWLQIFLCKEDCEQLLVDIEKLLWPPNNTQSELVQPVATEVGLLRPKCTGPESTPQPVELHIVSINLKIVILHNGIPLLPPAH